MVGGEAQASVLDKLLCEYWSLCLLKVEDIWTTQTRNANRTPQ